MDYWMLRNTYIGIVLATQYDSQFWFVMPTFHIPINSQWIIEKKYITIRKSNSVAKGSLKCLNQYYLTDELISILVFWPSV